MHRGLKKAHIIFTLIGYRSWLKIIHPICNENTSKKDFVKLKTEMLQMFLLVLKAHLNDTPEVVNKGLTVSFGCFFVCLSHQEQKIETSE